MRDDVELTIWDQGCILHDVIVGEDITVVCIDNHAGTCGFTVIRNLLWYVQELAKEQISGKAKIAKFKHEQDVRDAEAYANMLEWDAVFAIDCAKAAIEEAEAAVLDAVVARNEAEKANAT